MPAFRQISVTLIRSRSLSWISRINSFSILALVACLLLLFAVFIRHSFYAGKSHITRLIVMRMAFRVRRKTHKGERELGIKKVSGGIYKYADN